MIKSHNFPDFIKYIINKFKKKLKQPTKKVDHYKSLLNH